ncbi:MAG: alpha/beta fold hydrolase [Bacteroidetes bacterium]|nr:alpha/beta fold hydrolase [Bacteroidota bacterium]
MFEAVYIRPFFLFNAHLETIYPALFRRVNAPVYQRERITTKDRDFLDLDWLKRGVEDVVIISHGLEGNSHRAYVTGMANAFFKQGMDVLAWNYRGCSGEMNYSLRFYHSGATDDLQEVIGHCLRLHYKKIYLVGFSLGGNLTLKYLGEREPPQEINRSVVFSVPLDLYTSSIKLAKPSNWIYSQRFLKSLKKKVIDKAKLMKGLDAQGIHFIKTLKEFDDRYTAPLHGFKNAMEYYEQCSAIRQIKNISIPTLIINAKNDPFLSKECFPEKKINSTIRFEYPDQGGHVGFSSFNRNGLYWSEEQTLNFILNQE